MKLKERFIDLSDIKDQELDKTATFTDLMSRSERKRRAKEKLNIDEDTNIETNEITNNLENKLDTNNELEVDNISNIENTEEILEEEKQYEELTNIDKDINTKNNIFKREIEYNHDDFEDEDNKLFNTGLIITNSLFLLIATGIFIYSCIFTNNLDKDKFLMIDSISLAGMYFIFGLSIITNKSFSKFLSILNYLIFIAFTILNVLITLNYIK